MNPFAKQCGQSSGLPVPPALPQEQTLAPGAVLPIEALEHGAYYAGRLGGTPVIARWHAQKRRFVFGEFTLGQQRVRAAAHIAEPGRGERFAPLSKTNPKNTHQVSDYAFETAG